MICGWVWKEESFHIQFTFPRGDLAKIGVGMNKFYNTIPFDLIYSFDFSIFFFA